MYFFRPFIPKENDQPDKKPESKYLYFLPSFLDVLGTILDTTGLFYVGFLLYRRVYPSAKCSKVPHCFSPTSSRSVFAKRS